MLILLLDLVCESLYRRRRRRMRIISLVLRMGVLVWRVGRGQWLLRVPHFLSSRFLFFLSFFASLHSFHIFLSYNYPSFHPIFLLLVSAYWSLFLYYTLIVRLHCVAYKSC